MCVSAAQHNLHSCQPSQIPEVILKLQLQHLPTGVRWLKVNQYSIYEVKTLHGMHYTSKLSCHADCNNQLFEQNWQKALRVIVI